MTLTSLIYFVAFSHALMTALVLWRRSEHGHPGRILSVLLMVLSYKLLEGGLLYSGLYAEVPHVVHLMPNATLIIGPLFCGYCRKATSNQAFTPLQWLIHMLPAIGVWFILNPGLFHTAAVKSEMIAQSLNHVGMDSLSAQAVIFFSALKVHLALYIYDGWKRLKSAEQTLGMVRADGGALALDRQKQLGTALACLELSWIAVFAAQQSFGLFDWSMIGKIWLLMIAVIVLRMGYVGMSEPGIWLSSSERSILKHASTDRDQLGSGSNSQAKYDNSIISNQAADEITEEIRTLLLDKELFLDEQLTLSKLAEQLNHRPHVVSQVLNQFMGKNFYQLVNEYRINYAVNLMETPNNNWTLERIAYESGFGNRVSFNNAFKTFKRCSPSAYKKTIQKSA